MHNAQCDVSGAPAGPASQHSDHVARLLGYLEADREAGIRHTPHLHLHFYIYFCIFAFTFAFFCDGFGFHRLVRPKPNLPTLHRSQSVLQCHIESTGRSPPPLGAHLVQGSGQGAGPRIAHSQRCRKYSGWVFCEMAGAVQPFARNPAEIKFNRFALTRKSSLPTLLAERTCTAPAASTANSTSSMNSCRVRRAGEAKGTWAAHERFVSGHAVRI